MQPENRVSNACPTLPKKRPTVPKKRPTVGGRHTPRPKCVGRVTRASNASGLGRRPADPLVVPFSTYGCGRRSQKEGTSHE